MKISGERLTLNAGMYSELEWEHLHRYKAIAGLLHGKTVLDAACGTGYGSKIMSSTAQKVYGIDISSEAILYAQEHYSAENISFFQMSVTDIQFDEKFDVIVSFETIEHISEGQQKEFLEQVLKYLKEDGLFIVSTPDKEVLTNLISNNYQNPFHVREFTYNEFESFLHKKFAWIQFYYQNILETSVISNQKVPKEYGHIFQTCTEEGKYLIAFCSKKYFELKDISGVFVPNVKKYYLEKYHGAVASLFIDTGNGYNEEEKIVQQYIIENNSFEVQFNLSSYSSINALRFDPCEFPCEIEITGIKANVGGISLEPVNAFRFSDEWNCFTTTNPFFELKGSKIPQVRMLHINGNIKVLSYEEAEKENFSKISDCENRISNLIIEKNDIEECLKRQNDHIKEDNEKYQSSLNSLREENEKAQDSLSLLQGKNAEIEQELAKTQLYVQELEVKNQHIQNDLDLQIKQANSTERRLTEKLHLLQEKVQETEEQVKHQEEKMCHVSKALEDSNSQLAIKDQEISTYKQSIADNANTLKERERHIHYLEQYLYDFQHSTSWRITAPIRGAKNVLNTIINKRNIRQVFRKAYLIFPLPFRIKKRIKDIIFAIFSPFLRNTQTYKIWSHRNDAPELDGTHLESKSENKISLNDKIMENYIQQIMSIPFEKRRDSRYVDDISDMAPLKIRNDDVKYIAFYLPQYHPFPENDEWWGKGFTEWTNVTKAVPQFAGHYQPRLAGELGYYDLRNIEILKSQIKLAKRYGIYGFCLYYYWFDGKTLMEKPLKTILSNPELDLPFCLCWANENWSRRWDGKENDILISQNYTSDFPLKFIESISVYMKDPRYIRLNGKPLFIVYNANQIPDLSNTLKIWRQYIREQGLGELHLLAVDFALTSESKRAGFDGFIEFPPHSLYTYLMPLLNREISFVDSRCNSQIYDYQQIVQEKKYLKQDIDRYYKGICMAWDNTARKPYSATVYHNYSVSAFKEWLKDISVLTIKNHSKEDRFVFINAWNEWAEGTYLEPDRKFGYANLKGVRDVLLSVRSEQKKIIYVGHDAWFAGAQMLALKTIQELNQTYHYRVYTILKDTGSMLEKFRTISEDLFVYNPDENDRFLSWVANTGASIALCNTVVTGDILALLVQNGITCVSMIHEMEQVIRQYSCEKQLALINKYASKIVFASNYVKNSVDNIEQIALEKSIIAPQGMFLVNTYLTQRDEIRQEIRQKYGLRSDSRIVLGVGYGYRRKGTDIFLKMAVKMCSSNTQIAFMWVGDLDAEMQDFASRILEKASCSNQIILAGSQQDLMRYYTAADVFVLTSREDPFPSVVMEALYSYLPVIAFDGGGGYIDIISENNGCLVPMENADMMISEIERLIDIPELLIQKSKWAHQTITQKFNFISYIRKLLELLEEKYESVSVIIPNYNYAKYLPARIESVLQQTYPVQEIIILDDKSTDESREIIQMYQRKYPIKIRTIFNDVNSGNVFEQWKRGFEAATGKYIWVAEADDLAETSFLETLIGKMNTDDIVMSYSESVMINEAGEKIGDNYQSWVGDIDDTLWKADFVMSGDEFVSNVLSIKNAIPNVSAVLFRKQDFTAALDCAKDYHVAGDWMFYVQILQGKGKIAFSSLPLNYHRRHSSSVTTELKAQQHFDEICSVQQYVARIYYEGKLPPKAVAYRKEAKEYLNIKS